MPAISYVQMRYIYAQREKYKSKSETPDNMKWIWEKQAIKLAPHAKKN